MVTVVDHVGQWFIDGQIFDHITSIKGASNGRRAAQVRLRLGGRGGCHATAVRLGLARLPSVGV